MPKLRIYTILPTVTTDWYRTGSANDGGNISVDNPTVVPFGVFLPEPLVQAALQSSVSRIIPGHPLMIFDIPQVVNLTYPVQTFEGIMMNNYPVNRTDFRLVRGVQNEIVFFVRDIDRKPVSLGMGDVLTIVITDEADDRLLMQRTLSVTDVNKGIYKLTTLPAEMDTWPTGPVRWSMTYTRADGSTVMLWTDQNYSPYSSATITQSPYPGPAATTTLMWSDFTLDTGSYFSPALPAAAKEGYVNGMQTFVLDVSGFEGTVRIDASNVSSPSSSDWFVVLSNDYTGILDQDIVNAPGNYLWMRVVVMPTSGTVSEVQYKG